jgi:uncharacterized protein YjcR
VNIEEIEKDYNSGMLKQDIITKHHITLNQLNYQIRKNKWKTRKPKGTKGNKGGHGTRGNQNAVVTGAYSKFEGCFSEEELQLYNEPINNKKEALEEEIKICKVREFRILNKINELRASKDLIVTKMSKSVAFGTSTEAENTQLLIIRFEQALTKIQEAKRRAVDSLHKIEFEEKRFNYEKTKNAEKKPQSNSERIEIINDLPYDDETDVIKNE